MNNYSILQSIDNIFTEDRWGKTYYFKFENGKLHYSSHGAAQLIVNPLIRAAANKPFSNLFDESKVHPDAVKAVQGAAHSFIFSISADQMVPRLAARAATSGNQIAHSSGAEHAIEAGIYMSEKSLLEKAKFFSRRPNWVSEDAECGNLDAHYIMGLVGIGYKDETFPEITFAEVKRKMAAAVRLAAFIDKYAVLT